MSNGTDNKIKDTATEHGGALKVVLTKQPPTKAVVEDDGARAAKEEADFVKQVLDEGKQADTKITRSFRKSKQEEQLSQIIARTERIKTDIEKGLTAEQVASRTTDGLVNIATQTNKKTYASIFVQNIVTFFNVICIIVAIALICVGRWADLTFMAIMVVNTVIGIVQECRSKRMIEKLSIMSAPVAFVVRDGEQQTLPVEQIVLDDIMYLENGKQICADSVVLDGKIQVNEAMLTGESALVTKNTGDTLYAGSFVASGNCHARVEKVGNANYIESLTAFAKRYKKASSQLMNSIQKLIGLIGILIIPIAALMFYINFNNWTAPIDPALVADKLGDTFGRTAGAIIGVIPAGMFLLTSVALAVGVIKLANNHVLVQDLYCIEMLARADVLCLDKTGTITDGTMSVSEVIPIRDFLSGVQLDDVVGSYLSATKDNNQTAQALANYFGFNTKLKAVTVLPFSSQRKLSAVTFEGEGTVLLGAPEFVMPEMDQKLNELVEAKAKQGLRVLMVAQSLAEIRGERLPAGRKCIALICIEDHIRDDATETIEWFKHNDVAVKVISGDNPITVSEVARRAGIENAERFISLEGLSDQEVVEVANSYTVFGRVTPEQKRLLVRAIKMKGHTVAMTGDGVNDILALKEADCSIAMATGSEAARNVSHMVLMDSNFGNMPTVVLEGRRVINNIQKSASLYTMKTMFSLLLSVVIIILGLSIKSIVFPISPSNMLMLEMFVIGVPSFFLAFQPNTQRIKGKFMSNLIKETVPGGVALVLGYLALFIFGITTGMDIFAEFGVFKTMTILILTFTGWTMLIRVCQPVNAYRVMLCAASGGLISLVVALSMISPQNGFFYAMFKIGKLGLTEVLFVISVVLVSYVAAVMISQIFAAYNKRAKKEG